MMCSALDEAKAAYQVWLDVRAKRDEMLTEKQNKKPAPYRRVKVFTMQCNTILDLWGPIRHMIFCYTLFTHLEYGC